LRACSENWNVIVAAPTSREAVRRIETHPETRCPGTLGQT
jgi:hypothetical protein